MMSIVATTIPPMIQSSEECQLIQSPMTWNPGRPMAVRFCIDHTVVGLELSELGQSNHDGESVHEAQHDRMREDADESA